MKDTFSNLVKKLEEAKKALQEKKEVGVQRLQQLSDDLKKSFDEKTEALAQKRDLIKEAISKKLEFKKNKISILKTLFPPKLRHLLSAPLIYMMIIPALIMHIFLEVFHQICFRLYAIPRVKPRDHFVIDRHLLGYLNWLEKANCFYCSYFNGLMSYGREIAGRTERYWCPIKHARRIAAPHSEYEKFSEYLDAKNFRENWKKLRDFSDKKVKK